MSSPTQTRRAGRASLGAALRPGLRPDVRLALALGLALASTLAALPVRAQMYKYVDHNGVTVYSQSPPASGSATTIAPQAGPSGSETEHAEGRLREQVEQDFDRREAAAKAGAEVQKRRQEDGVRKSNCSAARKNLETVRNLGARRLLTPEGEYRHLSLDDRAKAIAEAEKQIQENCK